MAIFGAGSSWDDEEKSCDFYSDKSFAIGWYYNNAKDLYDAVSLLKAGDIIYLKANKVGSRSIRVKGIGILTETFIHTLFGEKPCKDEDWDRNRFKLKVKWVVTDEFHIEIPESEGKLTNVRSATFYEEYLPFVQKAIVDRLFCLKNVN